LEPYQLFVENYRITNREDSAKSKQLLKTIELNRLNFLKTQ